eukprot:scaffold193377_cov35-Tisochrysis_lutea.AAC.1
MERDNGIDGETCRNLALGRELISILSWVVMMRAVPNKYATTRRMPAATRHMMRDEGHSTHAV